jgi:XRCC1 N terminal domain
MKKRIISDNVPYKEELTSKWLDLETVSVAEITSEDGSYPIEGALLPNSNQGWKAASPGTQTIRLLFNQPQDISRIQLGFVETEVERTQEYVLRWSQDNGQTFGEIVHQQWNFSPEGSKAELADYTMALMGVTVLELIITPDISSQGAIATLENLRIA